MKDPTPASAAVTPGPHPALRAPWRERALLRLVGGALLLASAGVGADDGAAATVGPAGLVALLLLAAWAAPPPPEPVRRPTTWAARQAPRRPTALAAGCVLLAAPGEPGLWRGAAVAVLLTAYLLLVDAFGPDRRRPNRVHVLAALAASALVLPVALTDTGAGEWSRPVALLGVLAAAVGVGLGLHTRRPRN
ncbi:hypothetical protein [Kitasatospora sp. NPDC057500]|uniref:hypothetical protein n=1 Tax=Kitasatospora sp. NPDC057500 TaxID=3346151 RepID=UPI0036CC00E1